MSEGTANVEGQTPEPTTVTFNNKTYAISELGNLQTDIESTQNNLMSDYNKKMQEAKQVKLDAETKAKALQEDLEYLASHPGVFADGDPRKYYHPKVEGGAGEVAKPPVRTGDFDEGKIDIGTAFNNDPKVKQLETEVAELKQIVQGVQNESLDAGVNRVNHTWNELAKTYPNALHSHVKDTLNLYFNNNKKHPSDDEVAGIMKRAHNENSRLIATSIKGQEGRGAPTGIRTATPPVSGKTPVTQEKKIPSLEDPNFAKHIAGFDFARPGAGE